MIIKCFRCDNKFIDTNTDQVCDACNQELMAYSDLDRSLRESRTHFSLQTIAKIIKESLKEEEVKSLIKELK